MPFACAVSTIEDSAQALEEALASVQKQLPGVIDLAIVFYTPHHREAAGKIAETVQTRLQPRALIGSPGESIVGNEREYEETAAFSLWVGRFPQGTQVTPFELGLEETSEGPSLLGWPDDWESSDPKHSILLLLADPYTFPIDDCLTQINEQVKGLRVVGGMASGGQQPGENLLVIQDKVTPIGAVGVLLQGAFKSRIVVSQGCRPIGKPLVITKARDNILIELGGKAPLAHLQEMWPHLSARDQDLVQRGLHVGRVINEYQGSFQRGDFLVRNVMGIDRQSGALAITERVRVGQTVQFQVRDAVTADEDLKALLQLDVENHSKKPSGGLLFSCNGRGTRLFEKAHHDAQMVQKETGGLPLAGFFAQGELGPIGGQNFIHGFTASIVLFED